MKQLIRFWVIGIVLCFFGFCHGFCTEVTLTDKNSDVTMTGPESADVGRLIKIYSDIEGAWLVYPPNKVDIDVDSNKKILYFVAHEEGEYTIIFGGSKNGNIVLSQVPFFVGKTEPPEPTPSPNPSPLPISKISPQDKEALVYALQLVISGVDNGTIQTANGCRSTFKQAIMQKGRVCDGRNCYLRESLSDIADELTKRTNFDSAQTVKESFEIFLKEIQNDE